jgi:hypothetical protein
MVNPERCRRRNHGTLIPLDAAEHREVMRRWQWVDSGTDGERGGLPATPDDLVAHKLLDAAGDAMGRGDWQKGVNILRLIVKDYRQSQEAACARRVIDRLAEKAGGHGR